MNTRLNNKDKHSWSHIAATEIWKDISNCSDDSLKGLHLSVVTEDSHSKWCDLIESNPKLHKELIGRWSKSIRLARSDHDRAMNDVIQDIDSIYIAECLRTLRKSLVNNKSLSLLAPLIGQLCDIYAESFADFFDIVSGQGLFSILHNITREEFLDACDSNNPIPPFLGLCSTKSKE